MGLGAGWDEPENRAYVIRFPPVGERMDRLGMLAELGFEEDQFNHLDFNSDEVPKYLTEKSILKIVPL